MFDRRRVSRRLSASRRPFPNYRVTAHPPRALSLWRQAYCASFAATPPHAICCRPSFRACVRTYRSMRLINSSKLNPASGTCGYTAVISRSRRSWTGKSDGSRTCRSPLRMIAVSMACSNCRTLPGQAWRPRSSSHTGRHGFARQPLFTTNLVEKMMQQWRNVTSSATKRRQVQTNHVQPVKQILSKALLGDGFGQVDVCGGNDAHVHLNCLGRTQPLKLPLLEHRAAVWIAGRAADRRFRPGRSCPGGPARTGQCVDRPLP